MDSLKATDEIDVVRSRRIKAVVSINFGLLVFYLCDQRIGGNAGIMLGLLFGILGAMLCFRMHS